MSLTFLSHPAVLSSPASFSSLPLPDSSPNDFHGSTVIYNRPILPSDVADGGVAVAVFERETSKASINSSEPARKLYVPPALSRALGPAMLILRSVPDTWKLLAHGAEAAFLRRP
jgi:hypothetical protein